jgi:glucosamine--fructose-6-phosphate aminotransferase (isomerizing)
MDYKHRVAVIHNGTINNSYDLKTELQNMGIKFASETDTEVIAHLIGINLDKGMDTKTAVSYALARYVTH